MKCCSHFQKPLYLHLKPITSHFRVCVLVCQRYDFSVDRLWYSHAEYCVCLRVCVHARLRVLYIVVVLCLPVALNIYILVFILYNIKNMRAHFFFKIIDNNHMFRPCTLSIGIFIFGTIVLFWARLKFGLLDVLFKLDRPEYIYKCIKRVWNIKGRREKLFLLIANPHICNPCIF